MKRYIYILCAALVGVFASCSKSEIGGETPQSNQVTLKVTTDEGLQTRGTDQSVDRYVIEVYTDAAYTDAAIEVFGTTNKSTNATGEFTMTLDRTKEYYCLIWADKAGKDVYDITSLKAVTLTGNAVEAWHGTKKIEAGAAVATLGATLTRAVSKITLKETGKLKAGSTLKLSFDQPTMFNVATKVAATAIARAEETITIAADVDGTTTPVTLNSTDIFVLSSVATADLTDLTFAYNTENPFIVSQAPLKANFNTNIKGHYTSAKSTDFTVTADDEWETPDNEMNEGKKAAQVGDFYYKDKTFSSNYTADVKNPCIGIVFAVNADGKTGKIVGLTQSPKDKFWGVKGTDESLAVTGIRSTTDGATATKNMITAHKDDADFSTAYSAFDWVFTTVNSGDIDGRWYIPAKEELKALYGKYNGDTNEDESVKTAVNVSLTSAGATLLSSDLWSSTEDNENRAWYVNFRNSDSYPDNKNNYAYSICVISAF